MLLMLTDFRLYLLLGAAFVAGYARTADDRPERDAGIPKGRLSAAADALFLAAFPLLGLLFWSHGWLAGAASLLGAWAFALVGDLAYQRRHAPPPRAHPPGEPRPSRRFEQASCLPPVGIYHATRRVAPRFPAAQFPRHVRHRRPAPAGRALAPRH